MQARQLGHQLGAPARALDTKRQAQCTPLGKRQTLLYVRPLPWAIAELNSRQVSRIICKTYASSSTSSAASLYDAYLEEPWLENIASTGTLGAAGIVLRFIDALNSRDLSGMLLLLADDCHHEDLSHEGEANTKEEVARFYSDLVASLPERVRVVVDDITSGDDTRAGLMWHMEVDGIEVPCSRGLSFYRVRPRSAQEAPPPLATIGHRSGVDTGGGLITYIRQSPEHFLKLSGVVLSASASATPLIDSLGPMALPGFWSNLARGASNMIASAPPMEELLRSLAAAGAANTAPPTVPGVLVGSGAGFGGSGSAAVQQRPGGGFGTAPAVGPNGGGGSAAGVFGATRSSFVQTFHGHYQPPSPPTTSVPSSAALHTPAISEAAALAAAADSDAVPAMARAHAMPMVFAANLLTNTPTPVATAAVATDPVAFAPAPDMAGVNEPPQASPEGPLRDHDSRGLAARAAMGVSYQTESSHQAFPVGPVDDRASTAAAATAATPVVPLTILTGIWEKDLEASDVAGYEKALDMWQISGVQKATAKLIEGLELAVRPGPGRGAGGGGGVFNVHFLTIIPYFKVAESYPLGGGRTKMRRRDQRSGESKAHAEAVPNGVVCRAVWGAPLPGELEESYTLPDPVGRPDLLHVRSTLRLGGKEATTLQVYHRRRNMSARELIDASEKRNGKAHDVLRRFGMA